MEFVSYELAKKLKEKGFREEVYAYYDRWGELCEFHPALDMNDSDYTASAPTISQALKWLREEKKIHIQIIVYENGWYFEIWQYDGTPAIFKYQSNKDYHSYEQAAIAGVNYCLDNLI